MLPNTCPEVLAAHKKQDLIYRLLESLSDTWRRCLIGCLSKCSWHYDTLCTSHCDCFWVEITPPSALCTHIFTSSDTHAHTRSSGRKPVSCTQKIRIEMLGKWQKESVWAPPSKYLCVFSRMLAASKHFLTRGVSLCNIKDWCAGIKRLLISKEYNEGKKIKILIWHLILNKKSNGYKFAYVFFLQILQTEKREPQWTAIWLWN